MQPSRTRLICRARNRFNPSIALWQHFVEASLSKPRDRRQLSTATQVAQHATNANSKDTGAESPRLPEARNPRDAQVASKMAAEKAGAEPLPFRKMTTVKGRWLPSKVEAAIAKNVKAQQANHQTSKAESEKLLADARGAFAKSESYKGVVVKPMVSKTLIKESALPWCLKKEDRTAVPGLDRLQSEIARFYKYTNPDRYETIARNHLIEQVRSHVRKWLPTYSVEVFGSERTGVAMPLSDIDFRLLSKSDMLDPAQAKFPPSVQERRVGIKTLQKLYKQGLCKDKAYLLPSLRQARYPLVTAQDRKSGLDIQIVLANDTSISRVIMQDYMEEIPYLRELYWVVKTIFDVRGLSDVFRGGFGSYSLFMMVVASIKHAPKPPKDSARALVHFLDFWGKFDTTKQGVSIEPAFFFDKAKHPVLTDTQRAKLENGEVKPLPDYMLSLRDPADETNDLGRKGIAIKHVQATLRELHYQLLFDAKVNTRPSILGPLVGSSYMLQLERRRRLQQYGRSLMDKEQKHLSYIARAVREADRPGQSKPEQAVGEKPPKDADEETLKDVDVEAEDTEARKKEREKEETRQRLAREARDREWQRLAEEVKERLRNEAEKTLVLEHGDAAASIPAMPAVEEQAQTNNNGVKGQGEDLKKT